MADVILQKVIMPLHFSADILVYEVTLKKENVIHFHDGTKTCNNRRPQTPETYNKVSFNYVQFSITDFRGNFSSNASHIIIRIIEICFAEPFICCSWVLPWDVALRVSTLAKRIGSLP